LLADENGRLRDEFTADELHLNANGYDHLNQALQPLLTDLATP
jgi:lysophospholipase L1-like esterase